jgi:hypothetical protein
MNGPIVVASHPRSGTHLTLDTFRRQFRECRSWKYWGEPLDRLYLNLESLMRREGALGEAAARRILRRAARPLVKTHALPGYRAFYLPDEHHDLPAAWVEWLGREASVCYVYRDGRDVMCSYHLYMKGHDAAAYCSIGEFMRQRHGGASRVRAWADHVRAWLALPGVHAVAFEALVREPRRTLEGLAARLGLTLLGRQPWLPAPPTSLWALRRARLLSRRPETTAVRCHPPTERLERWREAFTPEDRAFFHAEAGDLLLALGYETSDRWVEESLAPRWSIST